MTNIIPFDSENGFSTEEPNSDKQKEIAALSGYELERILREAANYVEKNKWGFFTSVDETVKHSLGYLIRTVEAAHEAHDKAMQEHFIKLDDSYQKFYEKNSELRRRIAELPPIKFPDIPYVNTDGLQRLFDMAEKLSTLSDNQWGRLLELAEALKTK